MSLDDIPFLSGGSVADRVRNVLEAGAATGWRDGTDVVAEHVLTVIADQLKQWAAEATDSQDELLVHGFLEAAGRIRP